MPFTLTGVTVLFGFVVDKYDIATMNELGTRSSQQDSIGYAISEKYGVCYAVLADGMGGLRHGKEVSSLLVQSSMNRFHMCERNEYDFSPIPTGIISDLNNEVLRMLEGLEGSGGSTYIGVYIDNREMFFASVGDSKLYLIGGEGSYRRLNIDHNFGRDLDELVKEGKISQEEAQNNGQRNALTSYMGAEDIRLVHYNDRAIELDKGDIVILMSDGVTGTLSMDEVAACFKGKSIEAGMEELRNSVIARQKKNQDNFSAIAIRIRK